MGIDNPFVVNTTRIAAHDSLGVADPTRIEVVGETVDSVKKKFQLPINYLQPIDTMVTGVYPNVDVYIGGACSSVGVSPNWAIRPGASAPITTIASEASCRR